MNKLRPLRFASIAEATTLLILLGVAVPLKYIGGMPIATAIMGPIHGLAFLGFCWFVVRFYSEGVISLGTGARLFIGAFLPFGGFVNERWLAKKEKSA